MNLKDFLTPGGFRHEFDKFKLIDPLTYNTGKLQFKMEDKGLAGLAGAMGWDKGQDFFNKNANDPARAFGGRAAVLGSLFALGGTGGLSGMSGAGAGEAGATGGSSMPGWARMIPNSMPQQGGQDPQMEQQRRLIEIMRQRQQQSQDQQQFVQNSMVP